MVLVTSGYAEAENHKLQGISGLVLGLPRCLNRVLVGQPSRQAVPRGGSKPLLLKWILRYLW